MEREEGEGRKVMGSNEKGEEGEGRKRDGGEM